MLNRACEDLRRWMDEGKPVVTVSVNLSRRHMADPGLFEHIVEIIDRHDIPHYLIDFGIGYSSLNLIKQIPWDVFKLDKSIVPANGEDIERGTHLFHQVIAMAHEIGLRCIAEGVETEDQLKIMRQYGCRYVQGYIFDKPMPVEDFEKKLREGKY